MGTGYKIREIFRAFETRGHYYALRKRAHRDRKRLVEKKGRSYVNNKIIKNIKEYSNSKFGSTSFWPFLALYTEIREKFIPGWIPEDYYRINLLKKYNPDSAGLISGYKSFDNFLFENFSFPSLLYSISGNIYNRNRKMISIREAEDILVSFGDEIIIKPELGQGGKGIKFSYPAELSFKDLLNDGDFIIQPVCKQHHELQKINPNSLNTLRVFTFLNEQGIAEIKSSYLKFGIGESRVDNSSSGGGICGIHTDGSLHDNFYDGTFINQGSAHPATGILMSDLIIPNYGGVKKACKLAHESYPYVKFIGWDVAVDIDEKPKLIEWNARYPMLIYPESLFGPLWEKIPV